MKKFAGLFLLGVAAYLASQLGLFSNIDSAMQEWRFAQHQIEPSGEVVFVDIDARSLNEMGKWPWPRQVHARILDKLVELGAFDVAFDVDFSSHSTPAADQAFADALERAGGFTYLAAFQQVGFGTNGQAELITSVPLPKFREHAETVLVNVEPGENGQVWKFPKFGYSNDDVLPSLPTALAPKKAINRDNYFYVNYSIDATKIKRISVIDLLNDKVDESAVLDKKVIVGTSALELGDMLTVPIYGPLAGPLVHVLATETRLLNQELYTNWPLLPWALFFFTCLALVWIKHAKVLRIWALLFCVTVMVELAALYLQSNYNMLQPTFWFHIGVAFTFLLNIFDAMDLQKLIMRKASGQASRMQTILDRVVTDNFDGVVIIDSSRKILAASVPAEQMLSMREHLVGASCSVMPERILQEINQAFHRAEQYRENQKSPKTYILRRDQNGEPELVIEFTVAVSTVRQLSEDGRHEVDDFVVCLTFRDITHRYLHQKQMDYLANHDVLTGAFTRTRLEHEITSFVEQGGDTPNKMTVVLLDLDRFKNVNETLGHAAGDELLRELSNRLNITGLYAVSRLGADRFAALRPGEMDYDEINIFAENLISDIVKPYELEDHRALIGVSIGMTDTNNSGYGAQELISQADMALSEAKDIPGNSFFLFKRELNERISDRQRVEMALTDAVKKDQFYVRYQPQVDLATGKCIGSEALVRWKHPEMGTVRPDRFISVAEDSGMIIEIGRWVLEQACIDAMQWPEPGKVAVNVSAVQFEYGDVVQAIRDALEKSKLPVERLDIEITESVFVTKQDKFIDTLNQIVDMGVGVALDDFGTGYSSLSYLSQLPVDKVKIDQSFVRDLPNDAQSLAIVQSVLTLASAMDKRVIAEGIETEEQAWVLRLAGCGIGQGFLFGRPQSQDDFCRFLRHNDCEKFLEREQAS